MIILGLIALLIGYLVGLSVLVWIGWILLAIGLILLILGAVGNGVGGRRWWF